MLELIVLGQIPGTTIVITSSQAILALLLITLLVLHLRADIDDGISSQTTNDDQAA